jgi:hypothetical protein
LPAIKITGKIFKNYELDNVIWDKIKSKEYRGLSFGGATRSNRTPMKMKDGSMAYALSNLEHYEVAVCKDPAVPMAVITDYNPIAKATFNSEVRDDGKMIIRCTQMGCFVEKSDVEHGMYGNVNTDTPFDATEDYEEDKREGDREQQQIEKVRGDFCPNCGKDKKREMGDMVSMGGACPNCGHGFKGIKKADLNESQTFQQKVDALIAEGKSEESAKKIVGSFVHKDEVDKSGAQTEAGNNQLGGQGATEDDPKKRKEEDEEKEDDEVKGRDHSDAGGDIHSMYNQNVGRESSSGRKLKGSTTASQGGGGIREHSSGTYIQGSGETNDINPTQKRPERNEEKLVSNIKVVKNINNSLVKHAQTQQLKKIKNDLGDARGCTEHKHI